MPPAAQATGPWLPASWPAPPGVHALTTLRHGAGVSCAPFDHFNLGNRTAAEGDDPAAVEANRPRAVPGWKNRLLAAIPKLLPDGLALRIIGGHARRLDRL